MKNRRRMPGERYHLHKPLPDNYWKCIENAEAITLYSLLPSLNLQRDDLEVFHEYPVLGETQIFEKKSMLNISSVLRQGADMGTLGFRCFEPHHGIRVTDGNMIVDLVICFTCECLIAYAEPKSEKFIWGDISNEPELRLDAILSENDVKLAPRRKRSRP